MKKILIGFIVVFSLVCFTLVYLISVSPLRTLKNISTEIDADTLFLQKFDSAQDVSELDSLTIEFAYKKALSGVLTDDSIILVVNLGNSLVQLYIKGVKVHQTKVTNMSVDPVFYSLPNRHYFYIFSKPLDVIQEKSTIVKEPIVVRQAPKDTLEASLNAYKPDTLMQNPAFLAFYLPHNFRLLLLQDIDLTKEDQVTRKQFNSILKNEKYWNGFSDFTKTGFNYKPTIELALPMDDIRAIYRAVPHKPKVIIKIKS